MFSLRRYVLWFCSSTICLLCACGSADSSKDLTSVTEYIQEKGHEESFADLINTLHFSSQSSLDTFRLSMSGSSVESGDVEFGIISPTLGQIYSEKFPARALIGHSLIQVKRPTQAEIENAIIEGFNSFFQENHFPRPAISSKESYQEEYEGIISEEAWETIKKDSSSVGFYYLLWEGDMKWISFFKSDSSVKIYKVCC
ncbi:MAG: hypothetical protein AAGC85_09995 [Bacteroidota bacterium]